MKTGRMGRIGPGNELWAKVRVLVGLWYGSLHKVRVWRRL